MTRGRIGYGTIGFAIGALADGVVLHQILQWHHLWSARTTEATVAGLEENTLADGLFHAASLAVLLVGVGLVVGRRVEPRPLVALGLVGWGLFHLVDHAVFHLALEAHHIRMDVANPELYDWAFAALGVLLVLAGAAIARSGRRRSAPHA